jgi:uncharacterized membrane protein
MLRLVAAALAWIALHLLVAGPLRPTLVQRIGESGFRIAFSVASLILLIALIAAYRAAPLIGLWATPSWGYAWSHVCMVPAFVLLALSLAKSPTSVGPRLAPDRAIDARGVFRITRHPMLNAFALWAIAHLPANGDLASVILFSTILVTALNGMASIDRKRGLVAGAAWDAFAHATSRLPFVAIAQGRNRFVMSEIRWARVAAALLLYAAALWLHGRIGPAIV